MNRMYWFTCFLAVSLVMIPFTGSGRDTKPFVTSGIEDPKEQGRLNRWLKNYNRSWIGSGEGITRYMLEFERKIGRTTREGAEVHQYTLDEKNGGNVPKFDSFKTSKRRKVNRNHRLADSALASILIHAHGRIVQTRSEDPEKAATQEEAIYDLFRELTGAGNAETETEKGREFYDEAVAQFKKSLSWSGENGKKEEEDARKALVYAIRNAAQGPANLRFGDGKRNSKVGAAYDPNVIDGRMTPISDGIANVIERLSTAEAGNVLSRELGTAALQSYQEKNGDVVTSSEFAKLVRALSRELGEERIVTEAEMAEQTRDTRRVIAGEKGESKASSGRGDSKRKRGAESATGEDSVMSEVTGDPKSEAESRRVRARLRKRLVSGGGRGDRR